MKIREITTALSLEEKHFRIRKLSTPVIDPSIYTTFGRRLYEHYQKYKISSEDQREIERLSYLLTSFTLEREEPIQSFWQKLVSVLKS